MLTFSKGVTFILEAHLVLEGFLFSLLLFVKLIIEFFFTEIVPVLPILALGLDIDLLFSSRGLRFEKIADGSVDKTSFEYLFLMVPIDLTG